MENAGASKIVINLCYVMVFPLLSAKEKERPRLSASGLSFARNMIDKVYLELLIPSMVMAVPAAFGLFAKDDMQLPCICDILNFWR